MKQTNWTICPVCARKKVANASEKKKQHNRLLEIHYGQVPREEYERLLKEETADEPEDEDTLREDYEIGVTHDGNFFVRFRCLCTTCGFEFAFTHDEGIDLPCQS